MNLDTQTLQQAQQEATNLGIKFHHMHKLDKIQKLIAEHKHNALTGGKENGLPFKAIESDEDDEKPNTADEHGFKYDLIPLTDVPVSTVTKTEDDVIVEEGGELTKQQHINKALQLKRVVVICNNPNKRDFGGEFFEAGNAVIGTHRKYVPFGVSAGYHIPEIILNAIRERKCQIFKNVTLPNGQVVKKGILGAEFSITELPALTMPELEELKRQQALRNGSVSDAVAV